LATHILRQIISLLPAAPHLILMFQLARQHWPPAGKQPDQRGFSVDSPAVENVWYPAITIGMTTPPPPGDYSMFEIRHLQVFVAIYELRSFSRAAERVHLTQPTVSGHIRTLETIFGIDLFDRSGRETTPTKAGEVLYPFARQILSLQEQTRQEMALFVGKKKGVLEIGGSNIPGEYLLPAAIGHFKQQFPAIQILLKIGDSEEIVAAVAEGTLEIGMVGAVIQRPEVSFQACQADELVFITPPTGTPGATLDIRELRGRPLVVREPGSGTRRTIEQALERIGLGLVEHFDIIAEMGSTEAVRQAVKAGIGGAIISRRAVADDLRHGLLHAPVLTGIDLTRQFYQVLPRHRSLSPLAKAFSTFLRDDCCCNT
jgi:DNA-binding transcriptional LysR family regulator